MAAYDFLFTAPGTLLQRVDRSGKNAEGKDWKNASYPFMMMGQTVEFNAEHIPESCHVENYVGKEVVVEGYILYKSYDRIILNVTKISLKK